jgi:hypothetical protein
MKGFKELTSILGENVAMSKFRLECLAILVLSLIIANTTNLKRLCLFCDTGTKRDSRYRRLQRFFSNVEFDLDKLGLFLVSLFFESDDAMYLALDRTNWKYGKKNVNILVLAAVYRGVAIPIRWKLLDKQGNSNTEERTKIVSDFIEVFGSHRIAGLLGDREFIGKEWFKYLQNCGMPFVMRIKENTLVMNKGTELHVRNLFLDLSVGQKRILRSPRSIWGLDLYLSAVRSKDGRLVIVATMDPQIDAITLYGHRWEIESLFACLKGRGFDFEETRITEPTRIATMLAVLAIGFAWAHKTGEWVAENIKPITIKKHGRMAQSFFRYGIDTIKATVFSQAANLGDWQVLLSLIRTNVRPNARNANFSAI